MRRQLPRLLTFCLALTLAGCGGAPARTPSQLQADQADTASSGARYFMFVFGYQNGSGLQVNRFKWAHTFASFLKLTPADGQSLADAPMTADTISWDAAALDGNLEVCVGLFCQPEKGKDYTLQETITAAINAQRLIGKFGPYEITEALYNRAIAHKQFLDAGTTWYIAQDGKYRSAATIDQPGYASNCIHAVSDIAGYMQTGFDVGFKAAVDDAQWLSGNFVRTADDLSSLAGRLGVANIPTGDDGGLALAFNNPGAGGNPNPGSGEQLVGVIAYQGGYAPTVNIPLRQPTFITGFRVAVPAGCAVDVLGGQVLATAPVATPTQLVDPATHTYSVNGGQGTTVTGLQVGLNGTGTCQIPVYIK